MRLDFAIKNMSVCMPLFFFISISFTSCIAQQEVSRPNQFSVNENYRGINYTADFTSCPQVKIKWPRNHYLKKISSLKIQENPWSKSLECPLIYINERLQTLNRTANEANQINVTFKRISLDKTEQYKPGLKDFQKHAFYVLSLEKGNKVSIESTTEEGASNGLASLLCLLEQDSIQAIQIVDWPDIKDRLLQINLKDMNPKLVLYALESAWRQRYTGILLSVTNSVKFNALGSHARKTAMKPADFKSLVKYARGLNLEVVPHLNFLSHQNEELLQYKVDSTLFYNFQTLNPQNEQVYTILFDLIDEIDSLIEPHAIHIGHDEVLGFKKEHLEKYGPILPSNLFLLSVRRLHNYLSNKNIETQMWGDMLLHQQDFPDTHPTGINAPDSYREILDSIPTDITITDWHYLDYKWRIKKGPITFEPTKRFLKSGHNVYGATYKWEYFTVEFARFAWQQNNTNLEGMIATTWHELLNGSVSKKNDSYQGFYNIMQESANIFWNASTY